MKRKFTVAAALAAAVAIALLAAAAFGAFARGSHESAAGARIGVHGAWKIVVKNPDGRVVAVRRFHNALTGGAAVSSGLLRGAQAFGWWEVALTSTGTSPCTFSSGGAGACVIVPTGHEAGITLFSGHVFGGLSTSSITGGLRLSGQAFADQAGTVDRVTSTVFRCAATVAPSSCDQTNWQSGSSYTATSITPLSLVAGQQILVTVDITFSTV